MRIKRPRIRRRRFPASQSVFANDDVLHLGLIDVGHMQRLVIDRGFVQQLLDFVRANLVAKICDEREAIENAAGHTWLLPTPFLLDFSPGFRFRMPRACLMAAPVIGLSRIPSGVVCTTALVPFSISNSLRIRRGITTWPFTVNETVSALSVSATA
jgi:hypothetical protein